MDLNRALADHQLDAARKAIDASEFKLVLVAPMADAVPEDGFLSFARGSDVSSLLAVDDGGVLIFKEEDATLLRMLIEFQDQFGVRVKTLDGLNGVQYDPWFTSLTWSQDGVSYSGLLSEISIAKEQSRVRDNLNKSAHDFEREQYTRKDGTVKDQDNFIVVEDTDDVFSDVEEDY